MKILDFDLIKTNLILLQKSMKVMDKESKEYRVINDLVRNEIIGKVRDALLKDAHAQEIIATIKANNSTYFDEYRHPAFLYEDGDDDVGYSKVYNHSTYREYLAYTRDYDDTMARLEARAESIRQEPVKKWLFVRKKSKLAKMKKLEEVEEKIKDAPRRHNRWMKVAEQEELFNKLWFKDGKFVNINEEYEIELKELSKQYFHKFAAECLQKNPELMQYRVDGLREYYKESWCPVDNAYLKSTAYDDMFDIIRTIIEEEQIAFIEEARKASEASKTTKKAKEKAPKAKETTKKASKESKEATL